MNGREAIFSALGGAGHAPADEAPVYRGATLRFADPVAAFRDALEAAGGTLRRPSDRAALERARAGLDARTRVLVGALAVAENAAVWWVPRDPTERREAFLAESVVICVERAALVQEMHEAYRHIDPAAAAYGCFVSGPSKTADIEQALVIGAHGPRALEVWLWGPEPGEGAAARP